MRCNDGEPCRLADPSEIDRHWWGQDGSRLLPGEEGGASVFEISFWDDCKSLGYTDSSVFERVDDLLASPVDERRSAFVAEHCARMGSVVRCIASNLDEVAAAELRDELVASAPDVMQKLDAGSLEARECFLREVPAEPTRLTFAEWVKTTEEPDTEGEC